MSRLKRFCKGLVAAALTISCMTGCGANGAGKSVESNTEATGAAESEKIRVGVSAYPAFYQWYICEEEGFFEKYGLDVELVYFPVYSDSVQAYSSGQLDMLSMAMPDVIAPYNKGIGITTVMMLDNSNGADGLVASEGISSVADLKGKSVATEYGTIEHFFLLKTLETAGLTEKDINFVNLSISDSGPAFISGSVDAACLWEPTLSMALEREGSTLLTSSKDTPGLIPDVLVASDDMTTNHKEDIKNMINAYYDAMEFYVENEDKAIADMAKGAEISEEEMKVSMSGSRLFTIEEAIATMDGTEQEYTALPYTTKQIAEFLKSVNMIDTVPEDTTKMIDSSYLKAVLETRESKPVPDTTLE